MSNIEDSIFANRQSDGVCRVCKRRGCDGGPICEMVAEQYQGDF